MSMNQTFGLTLHQAESLLAEATVAYLKNGTDSEKEEVAYYAAIVYAKEHSQ